MPRFATWLPALRRCRRRTWMLRRLSLETAESRLRRRRLLAVASVTAAVIVIVGTALLVAPDTRDAAPPPAGPDQKNTATDDRNRGPDTVQTGSVNRLLTYSVGTTIHWGERTIDVRQQTNRGPGAGKLVDYVDATDVRRGLRHRPSPGPGPRWFGSPGRCGGGVVHRRVGAGEDRDHLRQQGAGFRDRPHGRGLDPGLDRPGNENSTGGDRGLRHRADGGARPVGGCGCRPSRRL